MEETGNPLQLEQTWPKVVLFGDSLTQRGFDADAGWVSMLSSKLVRTCDVVNRGFSGYTARICHLMAPRIFSKTNLEGTVLFIVCLGANDANRPGSIQHVAPIEYRERLVGIVDCVKSLGVDEESIVLMSPPPCCDDKWIKACQAKGSPSTRFESDTREYALACQKAAELTQTEFLDLHEAMTSQKNWDRFLSDGLHFSVQGAEQVLQTVWPSVQRRTKDLPCIAPLWAELDMENPEKTLFL